MIRHRFVRTVRIACPAAEAFAWHERAGALARLTPPWERVRLVEQTGGIRDGGTVVLASKIGPWWSRWQVEHFDYRAGEQFCDRQVAGPFAFWEHVHRFTPAGPEACTLTDDICFALPGGVVGNCAHGAVHTRLERMFAYRHAVTKGDLELPVGPTGTVVISGAGGLLGSALAAFLSTQGWRVARLVRGAPRGPDEIEWAPERGAVHWPEGFRCDAVIHLAGANVAGGRWTAARREAIMRSRVEGTRTLVSSFRHLTQLPAVFLSGSAIGFYGDGGEAALDEGTPHGKGFLADVCREWEGEAQVAEQLGVRTVLLRTGVVLSPAGGALAQMLPVFKLGAGGPLGGGRQWLSWIGLDDWLVACRRCLQVPGLRGPVNLVGPQPVRQAEFAATLARVLGRWAAMPAPAIALRLAIGQMADEALLASVRVVPSRLLAEGFNYLHPTLEKALRHVLGRSSQA